VTYTDVASCTPLRSPVTSPPIAVSSGDLESQSDRWADVLLSTPYGSSTIPSVHPVYPSSGRMLSLDPLRHLSAAPLSRFSHARVEHPSTRQPGFTVHHGAHSDLTTAGRSNHLKSISSSIYQSLKVSHLQVNKSMRFSRQFLGQPEEASTHESAKTNTASHVVLLLRIE